MSSHAWDAVSLRGAPARPARKLGPAAGAASASARPSRPPASSAPDPGHGSRRGSVLGFVAQVLNWVLILALLGVLTAAVLVPRIAGGTPFTVLTGSMEPGLPPGTLIVTRPTPAEDIRIGEVVTFQIESGKPQVVTHRVIAVRPGPEGRPEFLTQGDANETPDEGWRPAESVRGVLWYSLPKLGYANNVLTGDQRQLAVHGVATALILYALGLFTGEARDRRRTRREPRPARRATH
ncbi:signal peptidase I [Nocardioides sp. zg-579]|uniref:Signal peptidase I n=1 Tax=Nocardioides marmotae TaxID=2663857 RepID=A0A6I3JH81_9ACTN|nr:signal peptidase I [Gordonia jinghuaiqii]MTB97405.1 signal peptidase I [Nocardioides marmotae]QKE01769.1 signal peptidase I [Nocardioides marmotae]